MNIPVQPFHHHTLTLEIRVQPRASRDEVGRTSDGRFRIRVTAAPVDDAANDRVRELLAKEFGVSCRRVRIVSGRKGRDKRVAVDGPKRLPAWLTDADEV